MQIDGLLLWLVYSREGGVWGVQVVRSAGGGEAAEGLEKQERELRPEPPQGQGVPPGTLRSPLSFVTELNYFMT